MRFPSSISRATPAVALTRVANTACTSAWRPSIVEGPLPPVFDAICARLRFSGRRLPARMAPMVSNTTALAAAMSAGSRSCSRVSLTKRERRSMYSAMKASVQYRFRGRRSRGRRFRGRGFRDRWLSARVANSIMQATMCGQPETSFSLFGNLRQPMPWRRKLRLLVSNNFKKLKTLRSCCGNYDEPGC